MHIFFLGVQECRSYRSADNSGVCIIFFLGIQKCRSAGVQTIVLRHYLILHSSLFVLHFSLRSAGVTVFKLLP